MSRIEDRRAGSCRAVNNGFTLIELMVVVVLMAILSSALVPSIVGAMRRAGARTAAVKSFDLLNFARGAAIARRQPVTVSFDVDRHLCWVCVRPSSLPWLPEEQQARPVTLLSIELPERTEISFYRGDQASQSPPGEMQRETLRFEADGTAEDVVIELADQGGDFYRLEVVGATGEILLQEEQ